MRRRERTPLRMERGVSVREKRQLPEGIPVMLLWILQVVLLAVCVRRSYEAEGSAGLMIGVVGVLALILNLIGLIGGIRRAIQQKPGDKKLLTAGIILQVVFLAAMVWIFVSGILALI